MNSGFNSDINIYGKKQPGIRPEQTFPVICLKKHIVSRFRGRYVIEFQITEQVPNKIFTNEVIGTRYLRNGNGLRIPSTVLRKNLKRFGTGFFIFGSLRRAELKNIYAVKFVPRCGVENMRNKTTRNKIWTHACIKSRSWVDRPF